MDFGGVVLHAFILLFPVLVSNSFFDRRFSGHSGFLPDSKRRTIFVGKLPQIEIAKTKANLAQKIFFISA